MKVMKLFILIFTIISTMINVFSINNSLWDWATEIIPEDPIITKENVIFEKVPM